MIDWKHEYDILFEATQSIVAERSALTTRVEELELSHAVLGSDVRDAQHEVEVLETALAAARRETDGRGEAIRKAMGLLETHAAYLDPESFICEVHDVLAAAVPAEEGAEG